MNWFKCDENGVTLTALSKMLSTIHNSLDCSISGLLKTGETDLVLKHKDIKEDSNVEVYTNVYGLCPRLVTATDGSVTVSFKEQTQDVKVKVIFKRDIDWTALSHVTVIDGDVQHKDLNLKSATMPIPVSTLPYEFKNGSAVVLNDEIHILGSNNSSSDYTKHYKYDGSTWTSVSTLPYNFYEGSAVVLNNEIHILGSGVSGNDIKHYKYNGSEWVEVSTLPYSFYYSNAVIFNDEIHILGGNGGETEHYKYNGSEWVEVSTLPCNLLNGSVVVYNNEIHILGGRYTEKHYKYNGSEWVEVSTLPSNRDGSVVVYNNELHILGGSSTNGGKKHYKYNGSEWVEVSTLPYNFISGSAVVYNNELHILGGSSTNDGKKHYLAENYTKTIYYEDNGE